MSLADGYHDVPSGKLACVVTHLEMRAPADLRGAPLPDGLSFEELPRDVEVYRDLFARVGRDWLWTERLKASSDALYAILRNPDVQLWTLRKNGCAEAILELDFRNPQECELAYFGLTSELIGTGAGSFLMDRAIEIAWSSKIDRFHVHTCTLDSPKAVNFYIHSGFVPFRRQVEILDDPRTHGYYPPSAAPGVPNL